jgi:energy-coupling factor transporter ATP-binding protein EcfA2
MELYKSMSLKEGAELVGRIGDEDTVLFQGEMGIGKSSMLKMLAKMYPDHHVCYVDMTTKDVGDFLIPKIRTINGVEVCSFIPNEEFGFHTDKPVIIMLDEIGKCGKAVFNACLRLMQERGLGVYNCKEGSKIFATTNLATEGIGDLLPPHGRNRLVVVKIRKPSADEWIEWALDNDIAPEVILTVKEFPQMLASFEEYTDPKDNEYINDPRTPRPAFVTPRSLEKASNIIKKTQGLPEDVIGCAIKGTIGARACYDMLNIVKLSSDLPSWDSIMADPMKAQIPTSPAAVCMLVYSAVQRVDKSSINKWIKYMERISKEAQGLFATSVMRTSKKSVVGTSTEFVKWATANNYLFAQ